MNIRTHGRATLSQSLSGFLQALLVKRGVAAIVLSTKKGDLIGGLGTGVDLEWLANKGASAFRMQTELEEGTMYTHQFELNDRVLYLTTLGAPIRDDAAIGGLCRILAA